MKKAIGILSVVSIYICCDASFSAEDTKKQFVLKVLTYNIQGLPVPVGIDHDRYKEIGRKLRIRRKRGTAPHIVAIQEAFHKRTRELNQYAKYPYSKKGPSGRGSKASSGLILLSEYPIIASRDLVYRDCSSWDCFSRKSIQQITVLVDSVPVPIEVFNTHLNADRNTGDFWTPSDESVRVRLSQIDEAVEFIHEAQIRHRNGAYPLFFVGDFNILPHFFEYPVLLWSTGMRNATFQCSQMATCQEVTSAKDHHAVSLDHQYYLEGRSPRIEVKPTFFKKVFTKKKGKEMLSDHEGVEIHYELKW